ncbi:hypothetical protein SAMN05192551_10879 [Tindallia magadiensis]|uniref:Uncharacterized protein n=1 Tax=Tindallia magadiensis TaxID=69895 RepID=A0A1I3G9Z5_9FIRM|nr:hypothetical protein SAMN05192551_10879 [Tindallia magadiensis]
MKLNFIDIIFNSLVYISILLAFIGVVFRYHFDVFLFGYFFSNRENRKDFNGILKNSWKISTLAIVLSIFALTLSFIIHLTFRR